MDNNIACQDNKNAMLSEVNGKRSSSKCKCTLNIHYFFIADQVEKGDVSVMCCSADEMAADCMSVRGTGNNGEKTICHLLIYVMTTSGASQGHATGTMGPTGQR